VRFASISGVFCAATHWEVDNVGKMESILNRFSRLCEYCALQLPIQVASMGYKLLADIPEHLLAINAVGDCTKSESKSH